MKCRAREVENEFEISRLKKLTSNNGMHMAMLAKENHFLKIQLDASLKGKKVGSYSCGNFFGFMLCLLMGVTSIILMFGDSRVSSGKRTMYLPL